MSDPKSIRFSDPVDVRRVRDVFDSSHYSEAGISQFLGDKIPLAPIAVELPQMILRTNGGSPLETLLRLFLLNVATDVDLVRRASRPMDLDTWVQGGLLKIQQQSAVPLVRIVPYAGLLLACDLSRYNGNPDRPDFVMGLGGSSLALCNSTIRRRVESTLDLGSGCGIQSFLTARHSQTVLGVDRSPRATSFAQFNAQLNEMEHVEFIQGDLFEPVAARTFDLVVTNPPFVISPEFRAHYRDSGQVGDAFCQQIVRQVPAFLKEGGMFQMIFNWAHTPGERWQDRLAGWCEGSGCDAWVMRKETRDPSDYTRSWNREKANTAEFADIYDSWMSWYDRQRIEAISTGLITMRRNSRDSNWFRADDAPERIGPIGNDILQVFDTLDWLHTRRNDEELLGTCFKLAPDVRLNQQLEPAANGWHVEAGRLQRTSGLGYSSEIDPETADLLCRCNGDNTLGELLSALAARRNTHLEKITPVYLTVIRRLLSRGFLLPTSTKQILGPTRSTDDVTQDDSVNSDSHSAASA